MHKDKADAHLTDPHVLLCRAALPTCWGDVVKKKTTETTATLLNTSTRRIGIDLGYTFRAQEANA